MTQPAPKSPIDLESVKILVFANRELDQLVDDLYTHGCKVSAKQEVVGALVCAARRSPIEAVAAVVKTYWAREREEKARASAPEE